MQRESLAHPAPRELQDGLALWPRAACLQRGAMLASPSNRFHSLQPFLNTRFELFKKLIKNLWALFLNWNTEQSKAPSSQEQRDAQTVWACFMQRVCAWITPKQDKTKYAKCIRTEMKAVVGHGFPHIRWTEDLRRPSYLLARSTTVYEPLLSPNI